MSFALIDAKKAEISVEIGCAALGVSVSGYYAWKIATCEQPAERRHDHAGAYPRGVLDLERDLRLAADARRVARKWLGDRATQGGAADERKRPESTTKDAFQENHGQRSRRSRCDERARSGLHRDAPDQKWGVDISYVWTAEGWLYLAIVLDLFSRRIVGWQLSDRMKRGLAMDALQRAINLRRPPSGLIHHSDRGSQYCSDDYRRMLRDHGFVASMSGRGNCYDNAMVETVFKTIKSELIWRTAFATRDQASKAIGQYIEGFYNPRRRHSSLGYVSPATFEATFRADQKEERMALH